MENPNDEVPPEEESFELTAEEKEKFSKSDIDGLPFRFPTIWALSARCVANNEDALC